MIDSGSDDDIGWCPCGSAWFELRPWEVDLVDDQVAAVCISQDGAVTGYSGQLHCADCGEPWRADIKFRTTNTHLRVVVDE